MQNFVKVTFLCARTLRKGLRRSTNGFKNNEMSCSLRIQLPVKNQFAHKMTRLILIDGVEKSNLRSIGSNELSIPIAKCSGMCVSWTSIRLSFREIK